MRLLKRPLPRHAEVRGRAPSLRAGFALAPVLYLLALIGVGAGILFSGYSQVLRSGQQMSNAVSTRNDLQAIATTLAATSVLGYTDNTVLCPPTVDYNESRELSVVADQSRADQSHRHRSPTQLPARHRGAAGLRRYPPPKSVFSLPVRASTARCLGPLLHLLPLGK